GGDDVCAAINSYFLVCDTKDDHLLRRLAAAGAFPHKIFEFAWTPFDFIDLRQMNCRKSCAAILPAAMTSAPQ
ncbi:MAG: hypothetical protein IJF53_07960, partial [Clostridia bacterium]|nr:hypothetical protein [Clostridia bacterium]